MLCAADTEELPCSAIISTARWGHVRLRRQRYTPKQLAAWTDRIESQDGNEAYIFFKHEDTGTGPKFAACFLELVES